MDEDQAVQVAEALKDAGLLSGESDAAMLLLRVEKVGDDVLQSLTSAQSPEASERTLQLVHALGYALDVLLDTPPPTWPDRLRAPWVRDGTRPEPDVEPIVPENWEELGRETDA